MITPHPLDILFLTNFSDFCYRAIPSIAQMADSFSARLAIMHAFDPKRGKSEAAGKLESFFPEADRYRSCQRIAAEGPLLDAVKAHLNVWPVNLIVAPASDPIGVPRIGDRSVRARIIEECGVPVWTMGRRVKPERLTQPTRNVACWLDFYSDRNDHLPFAIEFANRTGAALHLLRALPAIHEGSLALAVDQTRALHPEGAAAEIAKLCADTPARPRIHVATGDGRASVARMLSECDADVVFLRNEEPRLARWLGMGLWTGDALPCPAIYIGDQLSVPQWNLEPGPGSRAVIPMRDAAGSRNGRAAARNGAGRPSFGLAELGLA
jgi:hypothetical protein